MTRRIQTNLRPHTLDPGLAKKSAAIYRKGRTPQLESGNRLAELGIAPLGPDMAAMHLRQIRQTLGEKGAHQAAMGLQRTRGNQFVRRMMTADNSSRRFLAAPKVHPALSRVLDPSDGGTVLPASARKPVENILGSPRQGIRIYNNHAAHEAAAALGARAFTAGNRIVFGKGQFAPQSAAGQELLAHEMAHAYQQQHTSLPPPADLRIAGPDDHEEKQARSWAENTARPMRQQTLPSHGPILTPGPSHTARIQRAISFTTTDGTINTSDMSKNETATGFQLRSVDPEETFRWEPDVTIHGNPGDPFGDWETAHHQVVKSAWQNIWWGTGSNRTHRHYSVSGALPQRDATGAANTWYSDWRAQSFTANGDTRTPVMRDGPKTSEQPWDNPEPTRNSTRGWFNYGVGFVATLSARHVPTGTGANAFRHLNHVHWNFGVAGKFNTTQPLNSRVTISSGGPINRSAVLPGVDVNNAPIHGGSRIIDNWNFVDT
ncbi:MAG: DUF4157 domain-containing protein [Proteobacteria bacterium]|nr:DUF4157 domain-containing protein [Pseudomonadota bacterium]MBU4297616.1 DUF4157 domain-containing protein [Pseudomonadota bacterium]MCG2750021.1 DUF4157 domain-containing protein [Desulfobulbaceae bacterium]